MSVIVFLVHGCTRRTRIFSYKTIRGIRQIRVQVLIGVAYHGVHSGRRDGRRQGPALGWGVNVEGDVNHFASGQFTSTIP